MDPRRLALVRGGGAGGFLRVGSGYLIGPRLVLTARHVVEQRRGTPWARIDVRVGHPQEAGVHRRMASVRWCDPEGRDVALLLLDEEAGVPGTVPWGRPVGKTPLTYEGLGYPSATFRDGQHTVEHLRGTLPPLSGGVGAQDLYVLDQDPAPDLREEGVRAWAGASGSAVFCQDHLVGVVIHDDHAFANRRLHACPARTFTADPAFAGLLRRFGDGSPALVDITAAAPTAPTGRGPGGRRPGDDGLDEEARLLEVAVREQWQDKNERLGLAESPLVLTLGLREAPDLTDDWRTVSGDTGEEDGRERPDFDGDLNGIVELYRMVPSGRLVVLGEAGSGKTVLAIRLVRGLLGDPGSGPPVVPVLFGLGSWNPAAPLRRWLADCLERDYPGLAAPAPGGRSSLATALLANGRILPVLDGFDEIAGGLHRQALARLNANPMPLVLTSHRTAYRKATGTARRVLTASVAVQLTALRTADLAAYLPRTTIRTVAGGTANMWAPVLERLRHPEGRTLAGVLETPLMVMLARSVYNGTTDGYPSDLLDPGLFPTRVAIEDHLLDSFIPAVYGDLSEGAEEDRFRLDRITRWLEHLAWHLEGLKTTSPDPENPAPDQARSPAPEHAGPAPELEWWRLGDSLRPSTRIGAVGLVTGAVFGASDTLLFLLLGLFLPGYDIVSGLANGLVNGVVFGCTAGALFGFVYGLRHWHRGSEPSRLRVRFRRGARKLREPREQRREVVRRLLIGSAGGFAFLCVAWVLDDLFAHFAGTFVPRQPLSAALREGLLEGIVDGAVFGPMTGLAYALMLRFEAPIEISEVPAPFALLGTDRTRALFQTAVLSVVFWVSAGIVHLVSGGWFTRLDWAAVGVVGGLGGAWSYTLALTAWGQWIVLARIWLPLTGRLPLKLRTFLEDAHGRAVLRQAGAAYRFRHARLQERLVHDRSGRRRTRR